MPDEALPEWLEDLEKIPLDSRLRRKESLKRFNTWRIGGVAECLIDVVNVQDLRLLLPFIRKHRIPWFIIGKGSNLLVPDKNWPGIILHLSGDFKSWEPIEENCNLGKKKDICWGCTGRCNICSEMCASRMGGHGIFNWNSRHDWWSNCHERRGTWCRNC